MNVTMNNIPLRPPIIVRAPTREGKKKDKEMIDSSDTERASPELLAYIGKAASSEPHEITVYTYAGVCPHGPALLAELRDCLFNHVDISQCKPPSWLPGTPTLVHKNNVYCGDAAFSFAQNFDCPKAEPSLPELREGVPTNPFSKKVRDESVGCGLSKAFAPPTVVEVDESKFAESTDDAMQRLLAGRR